MTEDIVKYETQGVATFQPIMSLEQMRDRYQMMAHVAQDVMRAGQDFGVVPGTGNKPSLLKPGAEKLSMFFGLRPRFEILERTEDWTGESHGGEPFFYYLVRCYLTRNGQDMASMEGSCNSWEKKYRYRKGERVCPECGASAIIKGKAEYGGGWVCFGKKGGCGAKFQAGDQSIEGQQSGQVPNADIFDQVNTILKMAEKRALVATVLVATGASEFFTQDMEDIIDGEWTEPPKVTEPEPEPETKVAPKNGNGKARASDGRPFGLAKLREIIAHKVADYRAKDTTVFGNKEGKAVAGKRGALIGRLNAFFSGDEDMRHTLQRLITDYKSAGEMDLATIQALLDWISADGDMAAQEATAIVMADMMKDATGQLFDMSQTERDAT